MYKIISSKCVSKIKRSRYIKYIREIDKILLESNIILVDGEIRFKEEVNIYSILNKYCEMLRIEFKDNPPERIVYHIDIPKLENKDFKENIINFHLRERELEKKSKYVFYFRLEFEEVKK